MPKEREIIFLTTFLRKLGIGRYSGLILYTNTIPIKKANKKLIPKDDTIPATLKFISRIITNNLTELIAPNIREYPAERYAINTKFCSVKLATQNVVRMNTISIVMSSLRNKSAGDQNFIPNIKMNANANAKRPTIVKHVLIRTLLSFSSGKNRIIPAPNPNLAKEASKFTAEIVAVARPTSTVP